VGAVVVPDLSGPALRQHRAGVERLMDAWDWVMVGTVAWWAVIVGYVEWWKRHR
jgi:hypothetical protein